MGPLRERHRPARILVVDDSAVVRLALSRILEGAGMQVSVAADPIIAMEKMRRERPDAIVLDIEMPRMDGLTFLRRIMREPAPVPVLVCSGLAGPGTDVALQALEEGAVDIVVKPRLGVKGFLAESTGLLVEAVQGALQARVASRGTAPAPRPVVSPAPAGPPAPYDRIVALGASTGGTEALRDILCAMPADAPPMVVVQHMPEAFTASFAARLSSLGRMAVREAVDGERLRRGEALIARGDHHLRIRRVGYELVTEVGRDAPVSLHRPSVDVLFRSVAEAAGPGSVGVILTGMGSDGAAGLRALRLAGAHTIAQDEATSVVYGMPGAAVAAGGVCESLPLDRIAASILTHARRPGPAAGPPPPAAWP